MIDWWMVATNSLWILGLSIILTAFGYHHWLAKETGRRLREMFRLHSWHLPFAVGMFLTCLGWGLAQASAWWETLLWGLLAATFGWDVLGLVRRA